MPLQLLNLGVIIPRVFYRMFLTRTPRGARSWIASAFSFSDNSLDYAELNAPPMINYGIVYPQAILMFVITMLYSVVQPLILIFGAIYFGVGYMVYKYKLLFGASDYYFAKLKILTSVQCSINPTSHKVKPGLSPSFVSSGASSFSSSS